MDTKAMKNEEVKITAKIMFEEEKTLLLTPEKVSRIINRSEVSLARDRASSIGIAHTKVGKDSGSDKVLYNVFDIAKFIVSRKKKVH